MPPYSRQRNCEKLSEWFAGNRQVEEDKFATNVAREYALFIYDHPWYDFPFSTYLKQVENVSSEKENHTWGEWVRKIERRIFLKIEYGVKTTYSWVIRKSAEAKFGISDDRIYVLIKENGSYSTISDFYYNFSISFRS